MGQQCCAESKQDTTLSDGGDKDLPAVTRNVKDQYLKFELSLPFQRILLVNFLKKIDECHKACGDGGFVTIDSMKTQFTTAAWQDLKKPDSALSKMLTSKHFKNEGHTAEQIDLDTLKLIAIFHCAGKPRDKAVAFYGVLQEGGLERHEFISA